MKKEDVAKKSALDRFLYWMVERHCIHLRRKKGKPKPWTDDVTLQTNFFTNPYRENDKVTVWFRDKVRDPLKHDPRVLMATVIFRWFNLPRTGEILLKGGEGDYGWLTDWDEEAVVEILAKEREQRKTIFTGAFMINSPGGRPKLEAICERISNVWKDREHLIANLDHNDEITLQGFHKVLTQFDGLGGFMAYEIVCDLRFTDILKDATDKLTWCNPGPGAIRGMYRIHGIDFRKGRNSSSPRRPKEWDEMMATLLQTVGKRTTLKNIEMREIEHSLCEFDKYERARLGDGQMKRKYNAT